MNQWLITTGMLAGGLGLFLLAVGMITDGIKLAAGHSLRDMLGKWTRSPGHGIVTGLTITAIVQSSSAVTVATIGFVNAGVINMYQALGVVYGANIGTTMTGWLIAIIGFKIKVETFALPMIGIGMILRLTGGDRKRAHLGQALAGFGLFFIGIDVLREAFEGMATKLDLQKFTLDGIPGALMYVGIGFVMTVLTQASAASIAIILTAATGGMLGLYAAAAMVIGANVGTTSTAAFAVIGATSNAKRVAAAHVVFNLGTGIVALLILPLLFWVVDSTSKLLHLENNPAVTLALFHTTFNILGVLLIWPISNRLARFLDKRFVTQEEVESRPRFLDKTVAQSPVLAVNALVLELSRIATVTRRMTLAALSIESGPGKQILGDHSIIEKLTNAVSEFIALLTRESFTGEVSNQLTQLMRAEQHLLFTSDLALEIAKEQIDSGLLDDDELEQGMANFRSTVVSLLELTNPEAEGFSIQKCNDQMEQVQLVYEKIRMELLNAGSEKRVPVQIVIEILEQNSRIRRMARQMIKAMRDLNELFTVNESIIPETTSGPVQRDSLVTEDEQEKVQGETAEISSAEGSKEEGGNNADKSD
jgi:phosphate:Na+ symporter